MSGHDEWFEAFRSPPQANATLFCFSHAGGSAAMYHAWARRLPTLQVVGVELPGRMRRLASPLFTDFDALLDALVLAMESRLDGEFAFFGHSLGALIAYEAARRLSRQPAALCVSGCLPPSLAGREEGISSLSDEAFLAEVARYDGLAEEVLQHEELLELVLPILRADFTVYESYRPQGGAKLDCPLMVMGGDADPQVEVESLLGWADVTTASVVQRIYRGSHFFINERSEDMLMDIEALLGEHALPRIGGQAEVPARLEV
ncbi:thioesterase II family protein [Chromobacterium vaccinii]|uniref:thioesterase II family protein n=1 Tax=Chromobacterium vaccinii TaxID=1108595 RepID=UPI001E2D6C45|nr:alpha/beta fold hydrolase [Chromobacterium vaccinii]MCD4500548.1 alpha/beta fold hydrolase [Chromobacterium vaccinii]